MTAAHYLSFPSNLSGAYTPIGGSNGPFSVARDSLGNPVPGGAYQNVDAKIYFSASTFVPLAPNSQSAILAVGAQRLLSTGDWFIGIDPEGRATFGICNFYVVSGAKLVQDSTSNPPVWNPWGMAVTSTIPIPTANLSPDGLFLRVYVNAYGGSSAYPGATVAPCVLFFTSPDAGTTFVQFGDAVPLPPRTVPYDLSNTDTTKEVGPYVQISGPEGPLPNNYFLIGTIGICGFQLQVLPEMQVYSYSVQDSTGRYLIAEDFTTGAYVGEHQQRFFGGAVAI